MTGLSIACNNNRKKKKEQNKAEFISRGNSEKINRLIVQIRDKTIEKETAIREITSLINSIKKEIKNKPKILNSGLHSVFPVRGYSPGQSIGGVADEGYVPGRYDFFEGNTHKGHPALDIFIRDVNQDCMDDITQKPVEILSMTSGVVIATEKKWDTASTLRGGKYLWIYDPVHNHLLYYAHNDRIIAETGQIVMPGDVLATCGRTGLNAFKKRSPTHLHLMILRFKNNMHPEPINPYPFLINSFTR